MSCLKKSYEKYLLPKLIDLSMSNRRLAGLRGEVLPAATGRVLEVGLGSGLNLPYYRADVQSLTGLDPSAELLEMARKKVPGLAFACSLLPHSAADMPFDDASFDTVVTTWTLCSIPNVEQALMEMRRVLKPGGELLFIEHGRSSDPSVRNWQNRLNGGWGHCSGGCNLNREIEVLIAQSGFDIHQMDTGYMVPGPRFLTYFYRGRAVRSA